MKYITFLIFFSFSLPCYSQGLKYWNISKDSISGTIVPSIHHFVKKDEINRNALMKLMMNSDAIYFETKDNRKQLEREMIMCLPHDSCGHELILEKEKQEINKVFNKRLNIDIKKYQLWYLSFLVQDLKEFKKKGIGLEQTMLILNARAKKKIKGLEERVDVLKAFSNLNENAQYLLLKDTLSNEETYKKSMNRVSELWREGKINQVCDELNETFLSRPSYYNKIIRERNYKWLEKIKTITGKPAIVVGLSHLCEEEGLINLLQQSGFKVEERVLL